MVRQAGFTLIELVTVLIILSVVAGLSTMFIVLTVDGYRETQVRNRLVARARVSIEQMTRYIRAAVPNSVRVSSTGNCLEFLPSVAGAFYVDQVADSVNAAAFTSSIATSDIEFGIGDVEHALIAPMTAAEIYTSAVPSSRVDVASSSSNSVSFSVPHQFVRNSISNRVYLADDPLRFCLNGSDLELRSDYGLTTGGLTDASPGGASALMANNASSADQLFTITSSSNDRNEAVQIDLTLSEGLTQISVNQTVAIRNVP